ncbi:MAG TPA: hypothetical protein PLD47_14855 [Aggregatilineales bacterium]|nr:hypothetical protein [Anaerolineales bacterium]HRE49005.1 hypothetical protein [Aggregatilineales bacterium]
MKPSQQLDLFPQEQTTASELADFGTFKDSQRAPIHRWFRYPAGYSYRFVDEIFRREGVTAGEWVYDPFSGTGTTLLCAEQAGINGYGVEAHSFVHWVASVKLQRNYEWVALDQQIRHILRDAQAFVIKETPNARVEGIFPELIYKCYHPDDLKTLYVLREFVGELASPILRDLCKLALTDVLRSSAAAGTGWPYIAPRKNKGDKPPKDALKLFGQTVLEMVRDLHHAAQHVPNNTELHNILGDSRVRQTLSDAQINLALTSPPYLNNYDYADRTRLEVYFWGIAKSWADITHTFRDRLIVAATTQVVRRQHDVETALSADIRALSPMLYQKIQQSVRELSVMRLKKGGKKDYDLMVALYFNDLLAVMQETYRVLKPGGAFYMVLGDSAPYGVHVHTDEWLGQLGCSLGFQSFVYQTFRARGTKWQANPQRHSVPLREGVIILRK